MSESESSAMLAATVVGIGIGGVVAGFGSGKKICAIFIPIGAGGMTVSFVLLGLLEPTLVRALVLLTLVGVFAGFYVIPILAMLQHLPVPRALSNPRHASTVCYQLKQKRTLRTQKRT